MRKGRTGTVRECIIADGPNGVPIYMAKSEWNAQTKLMVVSWTENIAKAKVWRYPLSAATWLHNRTLTATLTGATVCNARRVEGYVEK